MYCKNLYLYINILWSSNIIMGYFDGYKKCYLFRKVINKSIYK